MRSDHADGNACIAGRPISGPVASDVDAGQRSILFLDQYREHVAQTAPHVLQYTAELIIDGRKLDEPVNYVLARIVPPKDSKSISRNGSSSWWILARDTGRALVDSRLTQRDRCRDETGHPCYIIGFLPGLVLLGDCTGGFHLPGPRMREPPCRVTCIDHGCASKTLAPAAISARREILPPAEACSGPIRASLNR